MSTQKSVMLIFGTIVAEKRKMLGMSQEFLAEQVGISQESLSRMEKGVIAPRFERLQLFADALKCPIADLFCAPQDVNDRASAIAKVIAPLSEEGQSELMHIIARMVSLVLISKENNLDEDY